MQRFDFYYTDETAKEFSTNNEFQVLGIHQEGTVYLISFI